jgi:release factor glutamine methyltransferase
LLRELPEASGLATDISSAALDMARMNAERLGVADRITFREADFADELDGPFDIVVSNPPYVMTSVIGELESEVRNYDPLLALDGGEDGLSAYRKIIDRAPSLLSAAGFLALEVGFDQSGAVAALCAEIGLRNVDVRTDLAGVQRVVVASVKAAGNRQDAPKKHLEISG